MTKKIKNTENDKETLKDEDEDLDDEILKETQIDGDKLSKEKRKLAQFKEELNRKLSKMIIPRTMSKRYLEPKKVDRILSINRNQIFLNLELKLKKRMVF